MKPMRLKNSPIREALLDIRTVLPEDFDVKTLEEYHAHIQKIYPVKQVYVRTEASIAIHPQKRVVSSYEGIQNGYMFKTQENNQIIQFRKDGFTYNKLKPYTTWSEFSTEAKTHWDNYLRMTNPRLVSRIAARFINVIELPFPVLELKEYITTVPEIAPGLPQDLSEFFMRVVIPEKNTQQSAIITETIDMEAHKKNIDVLPVIFDIDVFTQTNMQPATNLIWDSLETIRQYANRIFFESLTKKALALFK